MKALSLALAALMLATPALAEADAQPLTQKRVLKDSFDNVLFSLKNAVVNQGLVVDQVNKVGEMLERTKDAVGAKKTIYSNAVTLGFCSAQYSRQAMSADPDNIQYCPYTIFVYELPEKPGEVVIGHRVYPGESMNPVNALLDKIIADTADGF